MKRMTAIVFICTALAFLSGCAAILEGDILSVSPHSGAPPVRQPENRAEASDYTELKAAILELVAQHTEAGVIYVSGYDGDVQEDAEQACTEIRDNEPLGAYAVSEITAVTTKIVSHFEVEVSLTFNRTKKQIDSIVNVSTLRYLRSELLISFMSDYLDEAVVRTSIRGVTAKDVAGYVREVYYQNPRSIVIMPGTVVEAFPDTGDNKIIELRFGNIEPAGILKLYGTSLAETVSHIVGSVGGDSDGAILLELAERLMSSCVYDEGAAKTMSGHGAQNFAATAYGALVNNSAVGEGYAMAYKALCDELGFECEVVLGYLDGMVHAWNIVLLDGHYYHIDVSMCVLNGMEAAFLKNDETLPEGYTWEQTVKCTGELTYNDISSPEA